MKAIVELISNLLGAVKEFFGFARQRQALNNTPEMQTNAKAEQDAKVVDKARETVAEGDVDKLRKELS